jgi:nucleotide-binding universal stress UspA family protein
MPLAILMYVDETALSEQATRFGAQIAAPAGAAVTLLAVANTAAEQARVRAALERAQRLLPGPAQEIMRPGRGVHELLREAETGRYDLIVVRSRGRRGWQRLAFGSLAARLARYSPIPVIIVKGPARPGVRRILACSAADVPSDRVARWSGRLAGWLGAELTLMHVMSQLALSPSATLDQLYDTAEEAIAEQTREGRHLARQLEVARTHATQAAQAAGRQSTVRARLRHGLVVDEVTAEAVQGDYDLVIIGGHQAPTTFEGADRMRAYLLEDVADQIVMALQRPVMVVKGE